MDHSLRLLTDEQLLAQCRWDTFRSGGPGGQKRQKTSSGVRLVHLPTGISTRATEYRQLSVNKLHALRRLKLKLAIDLRHPVDLAHFNPPDWLAAIRRQTGFEVSFRHPLFPALAGLILDLLEALHGNPAHVAVNLGVSTTAVIRLLESEPSLWAAANSIRDKFGLPALVHRP